MKPIGDLLKNKGLQTGLVTLAYWASGQFGALFVALPGYPSVIWPAPGIALAALLMLGYRIWPGILLGALLLHVESGRWASLWLVAGSALQPLLSAWLINCFTDPAGRLIRGKQITVFLILAAPIGCLISTLFGLWMDTVIQFPAMSFSNFIGPWAAWWFGNMIGVVTFTPACLVLMNKKEFNGPKKAQVSGGLLCAFIIAVLAILFVTKADQYFSAEENIALVIYHFWLVVIMGYVFVGFIAVITLVFTGLAILSEQRMQEKAHDALVYKELLSQTNELAEIGGWERDLVNDTLLWTEQCYRIHEIPFDYDIKTNTALHFCAPEYKDVALKAAQEALEKGTFWDFEYEIITARGNRRRIHTSGKGYLENNKLVKMFGFLQDITQRKAAEEEQKRLMDQLQHAQKMEALGQLAGGMSHEFNNMLQAILGYAHLALQEYGKRGEEDLDTYLQQICIAGERAKGLVSKILSYSRASLNEPEWFEPDIAIEEALLMLKSIMPSTIKLNVSFLPGLPKILVDRNQLHQIIVNLCLNARDAMDGRGQLSLAITVVHVNRHCSSCRQLFAGDFVQLTVKDDGPGIAVDQQQRIFEPFFTTKEVGKGTGMGLSVVHGIVHENHGHIEVISEPGRGTAFNIFFPVRAESTLSGKTSQGVRPIEKTHHKPLSILVVDDEKILTELLKINLARVGHRVTCFNWPREALAHCMESEQRFDLVILDQTMPDMTGMELATSLLRLTPGQKIILYSGYGGAELAEKEVLANGIKALFRKPVHMDKLIACIDELF